MVLSLQAQTVPLKLDRDGVIRVGHTRVRLDTVVYAFNEGHTAEEIVSQYPVLELADVYAVIAYYLNNRVEVDAYLKDQAQAATKLRQEIEAKPEYKALRERILARRHQQQSQMGDD